MKNLLLIFAFCTAASAQQVNDTPKKSKLNFEQFTFEVIEGRFAFYSGLINPVLLDPKLRRTLPKTYDEALRQFGPAYINSDSGIGTWQWTFTDHRTLSYSFPDKLSDKLVNLELSQPAKPIIIQVKP